MRRTLILVLLLMSTFWQGLALAGQASPAALGDELEHALLHWQDTGHHHHDDGFHADDSEDSKQHVLLDAPLGGAALVYRPVTSVPPLATDPPTVRAAAALPSPYVDRFRRPPRLTA